ncbi:MAG: adenylate kinase [Bdellovibrionales bacterium]|nr:adenylate kinase [Bdellovibrionales bacterium]
MNIVLLGAPGAGKGTQAERISSQYHLKHISTGDLFRFEVSNKTELGQKASSYMDRGELVPDEIVVAMIQHHIPQNQGFLLDGFPRTIEQAKSLDQMLEKKDLRIDFVVCVDVPKNVLVERLLSRGRSDDNLETIENRLEVYQRQTKPLISFYQDKELLHSIDGSQTVENVFAQIEQTVGRSS